MRGWAGYAASTLTALSLAACGGGGGDAGSSGGGTPAQPQFAPSASLAQQCAPTNTRAPAALRVGSLDVEKRWLRSYMDEAYLWYDQVPSIDASQPQYSGTADIAGSMDAYFYSLLTPQHTASGKYVDQFSFTIPTAEWTAMSQQSVEVGYGVMWAVSYAPNAAVVTWVAPGSAAESAGVQRGDRLYSVDNTLVSAADARAFYDIVFPANAGTSHRMSFTRDSGAIGPDVTLAAAAVTLPSVPIVQTFPTASGKVGYVLFNTHHAPAEAALIDAVNQLKTAGITDLVLDLRYNRGGYLYIASELAYMIAGPARANGRVFEKLSYNAKRRTENAQTPMPFESTSCILSATSNNCTNEQPLPTLNLGRVYVLATDSTCSASESIINGLRGIDVDVHIVGSATCGKPYGFLGRDNCGTSYFPMEFKGTNAKGFGDYADGFAPDCAANDDFAHALGSSDEGMLAAALAYRQSGACVARSAGGTRWQASASGRTSAAVAHAPIRGLRVAGPGTR